MAKTPVLLDSAYFFYVFLLSFLLLEIFFKKLSFKNVFLYVLRSYFKTLSNYWIKIQCILMSCHLLRSLGLWGARLALCVGFLCSLPVPPWLQLLEVS